MTNRTFVFPDKCRVVAIRGGEAEIRRAVTGDAKKLEVGDVLYPGDVVRVTGFDSSQPGFGVTTETE